MGADTLKLSAPSAHGEPHLPQVALDGLTSVERKTLVESMRALRLEQRLFLHALLASATHAEAHRKLEAAGYPLNKTTTYRWVRAPAFVKAWRLLERSYVRNITKEGVIAKTQALMEVALTPKPILYKGEDTGYTEIDLGAATRALELQGKAVGAWSDEQQKTVVNIDIDFSGRPPEVQLRDVIEGEIVEPTDLAENISQSRPTGSGLASDEDWLDG